MTAFPSLKNEDIDSIISYVENFKAPSSVAAAPGAATSATPKGDNTLLYTILTIVLLLIIMVLASVNKVLSRAANAKEGVPSPKNVPFFRNKVVIALLATMILVGFGVWLTQGAEFGRQKNYMPKQPIFYSHKVHAGVNQVNCLYCHSGAEKGRHAMIPSTTVCMNCHKQINEYTGAEGISVHLEGNTIDGTAEIKKLYDYAGWDPKRITAAMPMEV